jgi:hypothetical protein
MLFQTLILLISKTRIKARTNKEKDHNKIIKHLNIIVSSKSVLCFNPIHDRPKPKKSVCKQNLDRRCDIRRFHMSRRLYFPSEMKLPKNK